MRQARGQRRAERLAGGRLGRRWGGARGPLASVTCRRAGPPAELRRAVCPRAAGHPPPAPTAGPWTGGHGSGVHSKIICEAARRRHRHERVSHGLPGKSAVDHGKAVRRTHAGCPGGPGTEGWLGCCPGKEPAPRICASVSLLWNRTLGTVAGRAPHPGAPPGRPSEAAGEGPATAQVYRTPSGGTAWQRPGPRGPRAARPQKQVEERCPLPGLEPGTSPRSPPQRKR